MIDQAGFLALCAKSGVNPDSIPDRRSMADRRPLSRPACSLQSGLRRDRRRMWGGSSALPPQLRSMFTPGEQAVMTVIRDQVRRRGVCALAYGSIAKRAGLSGTTVVKRAVRIARVEGLIGVQHRRISRDRNLPNIITIVSGEWLAWMKNGARGKGGGGTAVPSEENLRAFKKKERTKEDPSTRPPLSDASCRRILQHLGAGRQRR